MNGCFSESYAEAREKFVGAAREAGAVTNSFALGVQVRRQLQAKLTSISK